MKHFFVILIASLFWAHTQADELDHFRMGHLDIFLKEKRLEKAVRSLGRVYNTKRSYFTGNSVFISPSHVLTNAHVMLDENCKNIKFETLVTVDGLSKGKRAQCENILFSDKKYDVALIETSGGSSPHFLKVSKELLKEGEIVEGLSYFSTHMIHTYHCTITGVENIPDEKLKDDIGGITYRRDYIESGCLGERGQSGSPVFTFDSEGLPILRTLMVGHNGIISSTGAYVRMYARLPDVIKAHPAEFAQVDTLLEDLAEEAP